MLRKNKYGGMIFFKPDGDGGDHFDEQDHERSDGDGDGGDDKTPKTDEVRKAAFFKKFSASANAPTEQGGDPGNANNQGASEQHKLDAIRIAKEQKEAREKAQQSQQTRKEAGSNVPKILESKREAEKKALELEAKVEEFTKTKEPAYLKQIADLEAKVNSGELSSAKETEYQTRISTIENQIKEEKDALVNENTRLKQRVEVFDLSENEQFQEEFLRPIATAHEEAKSILAGDEKKMTMLHRACLANAAALRSTNAAERQSAETDRDTIMTSLLESLPSFTAQRLTTVMGQFIEKTRQHMAALQNHQQTAQNLTKRGQEEQQKAYARTLETWDRTYRAKASVFDTEFGLTDDEVKDADELGLKVADEIKEQNLIASKVIVGQSGMESAVEMIHRGRIHPYMKAKIALQAKKIADQAALIEKLRAGGTGGGEGGGSSGTQKKDKLTREQFHSRFSANRPELQQH